MPDGGAAEEAARGRDDASPKLSGEHAKRAQAVKMLVDSGCWGPTPQSADATPVSDLESSGPEEQEHSDAEQAAAAAATAAFYQEIEPFSDEKIMSVVEIAPAPGKGQCMYTKHSFEPGGLILVERPLFVVTPDVNRELWTVLNSLNDREPLQLSPLWHQAALTTILTGTPEKIEIMKGKWVLDKDPPVSEDVYRILEATCDARSDGEFVYANGVTVDPKLYQFLLQVWPLNAFGHSTDPDGLVIYNKISFLAHSCDATACWHHFGNDYFMLRSRRRLRPGDELTISYLGEPDLLSPTHKRRELLKNWSFHCECSRCVLTQDRARGFLCKLCHFGRISVYEDRSSGHIVSVPCTLCEYRFTPDEITEYLELERAYIERIETIDTNDLTDIQQVYNHARNVFKQHWCIYQLQTLMFDCFKERGDSEQARYYLQQRIAYTDLVMPRPLYCIAFMYEEMADLMVTAAGLDFDKPEESDAKVDINVLNTIMDTYFRSAALLAVLSGYNHAYYYAVVAKRSKVEGVLDRALRIAV